MPEPTKSGRRRRVSARSELSLSDRRDGRRTRPGPTRAAPTEIPQLLDRDSGEAADELQVRVLRVVLGLEHRLGVDRGAEVFGDLTLGEHSEAGSSPNDWTT